MLGFGYCLVVSWLFCFLCFTSSVSLTGFYTEDEPASRFTLTQAMLGLSLYFRKTPQTTKRTVYQMFKYDNSILYCIKRDVKLILRWNNGSILSTAIVYNELFWIVPVTCCVTCPYLSSPCLDVPGCVKSV